MEKNKNSGKVKGETRANGGLWDEGKNKYGGSENLTVYLSL